MMKKLNFAKSILLFSSAIFLLFISNISAQKDNISLNLVYPKLNERLELTGKPFYFIGTIYPKNSKLRINEEDALVSSDGAFIGLAKVNLYKQDGKTFGKFNFKITSSEGVKEFEKDFEFKEPLVSSPRSKLEFDKKHLMLPDENQSLTPGSLVNVEVKATPGIKAYFNVEGINQNYPLAETKIINSFYWSNAVFGNGFEGESDTVEGIYQGSFCVEPGMKNSKIKFTISSDSLGSLSEFAPGKISSFENKVPKIIQTKSFSNPIVGRYAPEKGYELFLDGGINLLVTGKAGSWYECKLAGDESVYVPDSAVTIMPEGTAFPRSSIYTIRADDSAGFVTINIGLTKRCPYKIIQHEDTQTIELLIYNVTSNIDWITYDKKNDFIKQITWNQPKNNVLKVEIYLNEKTFWGYSAGYKNSLLQLKINKPALRNSFFANPLKGRIIVLDPGHNPDTGAEGPRGTLEKDVNLEISIQLEKMLKDAGAEVFLTHTTDPLPLRERKEKVNSFNPEISISIHNNAVPEGADPLEHNGSSVYYYFPQALPLAKLIHENLLKEIQLNDFGLFWDNLYMTRIPESISVLVEPAFMILPDQEAMLLNNSFRNKIAKAIFNAVKEFYKEYSQ